MAKRCVVRYHNEVIEPLLYVTFIKIVATK